MYCPTDRRRVIDSTVGEAVAGSLPLYAGALDGKLMKIFLRPGNDLKFAEEHLDPGQIDEVNVDAWLAEFYVEPVAPT